MFTGGDDTDTFEKRAVEAEETISLLQSQLMLLKKAAGMLLKNYGQLVQCSGMRFHRRRAMEGIIL